jgi:NAD+ synthase (glutamine-hydrolysing)
VKIALAQINPTVGDFAGNSKKILDYATRAGDLGVDLVVFPELAVCGYPPADLLEKAVFIARAEEVVTELARWTAGAGRPAILCGTVMDAVAFL